MPLYLGGQRMARLYRGATPIVRVYRGTEKVFEAEAAAPAPEFALTDAQGSGADLTTYDFTSMAFGAEDAGRYMLACIVGGGSTTANASACSVGGQATSAIVAETDTNIQAAAMRITSAALATGISGTTQVEFGGGKLRAGVALYRMVGWNPAAYDTDARGGAGDSPGSNISRTAILDIPAGGIAVALAFRAGEAGNPDWTNTTQDSSTATEGGTENRIVTASAGPFAEAQSGYEITANTCRLLLAASFAPA